MTNEEAINDLEEMKTGLYPWDIRPLADFCIEAIKKSENCELSIESTELTLKEVIKYCKTHNLILLTESTFEDLKNGYSKDYQIGYELGYFEGNRDAMDINDGGQIICYV